MDSAEEPGGGAELNRLLHDLLAGRRVDRWRLR